MSGTVLSEEIILDKTKVASLSDVRHLNLWGMGLHDISIVKKLSNIQVLALATNNISSLKSFSSCQSLEELYLRKNQVTSLNEVTSLKDLKKLHTLWLIDNPCAKHPLYREFVMHCCTGLKQLDNVEVTAEERMAAAKKLTTKALDEILGRGNSGTTPKTKAVVVSTEPPAAAGKAASTRPTSSSATPRTGRTSAVASTNNTANHMIEEKSASGKSVLFTTVQAQRAMLTSVVSLLPELTVESLELLEREVHARVEKQKQQHSKASRAESSK